MRTTCIAAILLGLVLGNQAIAAPETVQECYELPGSNVEIGYCLADLQKLADARVERAYAAATRRSRNEVEWHAMTRDGPDRLRDAQKEWHEFREHHCRWVSAHRGSGAQHEFRTCMIRMAQAREQELGAGE